VEVNTKRKTQKLHAENVGDVLSSSFPRAARVKEDLKGKKTKEA